MIPNRDNYLLLGAVRLCAINKVSRLPRSRALLTLLLLLSSVTLSSQSAWALILDPIIYDTGPVPLGAQGNDATQWVQADTFRLGMSYNVTGGGVYVAGLGDFSRWTGELEYYFFDDNVVMPGNVLTAASATTLTAVDTGVPWCCGGNIHFVEFDLVAPVTLTGGTDYWLGIHLAADFDRNFVYWLHQGVPGDAMESQFGTFDNWTIAEFKGAPRGFHLRGVPVPEPSLWTLMSVAGVGCLRQRTWSVL